MQVLNHPRTQRKYLALGMFDGSVRIMSLDDPPKEYYCSPYRNTLLGPTFLAVHEFPSVTCVISINGSGVMSILDVEKKDLLCEKRILLNRVSVREKISQYMSETSNNLGSVRASMWKSVNVLSKEKDLVCITVGNEWSLMSLKELREWCSNQTK